MNNTLEFIEDYFCNRLGPDQRSEFEKKCQMDEAFSNEVAFYIATRAALKEKLREEKKKNFEELHQVLSVQSEPKTLIIKIWPYLSAAACLLLFFTWLFFLKAPESSQLADQYIKANIENLSVNMGSEKDSIQMGIEAFNLKNYKLSENIFTLLAQNKESRTEAVKYLGFIYLVTEKYDRAFQEFDTLSKIRNLHANPGNFYKALTLMKRSSTNDEAEANKLLEEVAEKKLPGYKEAIKWKHN